MGVVSGGSFATDGSKTKEDGTVEDLRWRIRRIREEGEGGDCFSVEEGWIRSSFGEGRCRRNR